MLYAEERPRDFAQRLARGERGIAGKQRIRHRGRRLTALAVAIAVPAMASPADWRAPMIGANLSAKAAPVTPMPFETAGSSFPGSAFFYLADPPRIDLSAARADLGTLDGARLSNDYNAASIPPLLSENATSAGLVTAAARSFRQLGSGTDKARALQCLSLAIYYEAASESIDGQKAVAQVVLNRVSHPTYPGTVCGVVFQGSERRTGCQFSFTCDGSMARKAGRASWNRARGVAVQMLGGEVFKPVGTATHYHTTWVNPYWAPSLDFIRTIGAHRFYRWKGAAGRLAAFTGSYRGGEPLAAPAPRPAHNRAWASADQPSHTVVPSALTDPVVLAQAYEAARKQAAAAVKDIAPDRNTLPVATPSRADAIQPQSGAVRPEYADSGRWIARPTQ
ncbi:N-acetylmuramoyl-L-alanine amidase [Alteripontixanthobacter maritimus]|uniref:N-acetylmuramoyl-L-alanine amidase n=2 Tax=Alteripontixanthobacter maritimus TaxID=2161824 RepID=A0A369QAH9_9SPHN|nr:N-acetylmuramoyl-L-alanine amidase [Alteripontixanthobacter maritimus]